MAVEFVSRRGTDSFKWDLRPEGAPEDVIPMWVADMDFRSPKEIIDAISERLEHGVFGYTFVPERFKKAISKWWKEKRIHVDEDWIVPTTGVVTSIAVALDAFTEEGDGVVVQSPVYWPFYEVIEMNRRRVVVNRLIEKDLKYEMDLEDLERKLLDFSVFLLCNPHNPVGRVWNFQELEDLSRILKKSDALIISDEIHMDFVFEGNFTSMLQMEEIRSRLIVLSSPNKTFNIPALQNGYAIIPNENLRKKFEDRLKALHIHRPNVFSIVATIASYEIGGDWLEEVKRYISENSKSS